MHKRHRDSWGRLRDHARGNPQARCLAPNRVAACQARRARSRARHEWQAGAPPQPLKQKQWLTTTQDRRFVPSKCANVDCEIMGSSRRRQYFSMPNEIWPGAKVEPFPRAEPGLSQGAQTILTAILFHLLSGRLGPNTLFYVCD